MALKKICSKTGCHKIVDNDVVYCNYHQQKYDESNKERYKKYQVVRLMDKEQRKYHNFYCSKEWESTRDYVINKYFGMDIVEYYRTGKIVQGYTIHHIECLDECWDKSLDINNLIYLTEQNHRQVHEEYLKGKKEKELMQRVLKDLLNKFIKEFGL